eukprot:c12890_g1_i2.p1 GENE.c12890_g1_i2~~c12890_g1_i2.p1  ORF type:complete len:1205 (-),score=269.36 c12890_g1_i2:483-4097(-)
MDKLNQPPPRPSPFTKPSTPTPASSFLPATPANTPLLSLDEVGSLCEAFASLDVTRHKKTCCELLTKIIPQGTRGPLFSPDDSKPIFNNLRACVHSSTQILRELALRALRYLSPTPELIFAMLSHSMSISITAELERPPNFINERVQALKLAQHIATIAPRLVPPNILRSLVAIASEPSDNLRRFAVEAIRSISVQNVAVVAQANGFRVLTSAVLEPDLSDLAESIVMTLMFLLNEKSTRRYLRSGLDIDVLLSPFTDFNKPDQGAPALAAREEKLSLSSKAVVTMMRSWTGLIALTCSPRSNQPSNPSSTVRIIDDPFASFVDATQPISVSTPACGLQSLINSLLLPPELNEEVRLHDHIFRTLGDILEVAVSRPDQMELSGLPPRRRGHNLIHNYASMVLLAMIHAGAVEILTITGKSSDDSIAQQSTELLGRMLVLASTLLPPTHCEKLHSLPELVTTAASFDLEPLPRLRANKMLTDLHLVSRNTITAAQHAQLQGTYNDASFQINIASGLLSNSEENNRLHPRPSMLLAKQGASTRFHLDLLVAEATKWRRLRGMDIVSDRLEWVKRKLDASMDDAKFNALLIKSAVSLTKDTDRWQWDVILDLLEGALLNPARTREAMGTKFFKRLLSFMRPSKKLFCVKPWNPDRMFYVRALCRVVEVLTQSEDGIVLIKNSDVFQQVNKHMMVAVDMSPSDNSGSITSRLSFSETDSRMPSPRRQNAKDWCMFDVDSVSTTMAREYFTIIGFLTKSKRGLDFMKSITMFKTLNKVSESDRDDLNRLLITSLDYNTDDQCRIFLSKLMTSGSKPLRLHCTRHLRVMLRAGIPGFDKWGIEHLTTQLYDQDEEVALAALDVLAEACIEINNLNTFVRMRPSLKHLGAKGRDMMLRIMRTSVGIRFLEDMQWIHDEMERWHRQANVEYVTSVEMKLIYVLNSGYSRQTQDTLHDNRSEAELGEVVVPPHFYGELVHTSVGLEILKASGHLQDFIRALDGSSTPLQVRAALWALGHISSSVPGLELAKQYDVVNIIVSLAHKAECLSIRGTCCYVLGLVASTDEGRELLASLSWLSPSSIDTPVSVPRSPLLFFNMPDYVFEGSATQHCPDLPSMSLDPEETAIFTYLSNLSNSVTKKVAMENLTAVKKKRSPVLKSPALFLQAQEMLAYLSYPLTIRRFIQELFSDVDIQSIDKYAPASFIAEVDDQNN